MIEISCRALDQWPGTPTRMRKRSPFQANYSATVDLLDRELTHLRARNVVLLVDCEPSQLRLDGRLRSDARLRSPGVVIAFESKKGALQFPCDAFTDWQANVRAIALSLEALRRVDRYGVTRRSEQYTGWTALPPAAVASDGGDWATVENAAEWLVSIARMSCKVRDVPANLSFIYREAAKMAHPDMGGSNELMSRVTRARDFIRTAMGSAS